MTDATPACPTRDELEGFLQQDPAAQEGSPLEAHVNMCPDCQAAIGALLLSPHPTPGSVDPGPPTEDRRPTPPDGYELLEPLDKGGAGVVWKAEQLSPRRLVAIKFLHAGAGSSAEAHDRFRSEAEAAARIRHPNIVQVYGAGTRADGESYLVMEFLNGGSLKDRLTGEPWAARRAAALIAVLAGAVADLHARGVIHRDLKPGNVLLDTAPASGSEFGFIPKIGDFGLAKLFEDSTPALTRNGQVIGTPEYMAPEQAAGRNGEVGPAADVYALGAVLYELLVGRPPFRGESPVATLDLVRTADPLSPRRLNPAVPKDLETVCLKCLEKDPARRYRAARELAADLELFLAGRPVGARPIGRIGRGWRWCRRKPALAAAMAIASFAAVGAVVLAVLFAVSEARNATRLAREQEQTEVALRDSQQHAQTSAELAERAGRYASDLQRTLEDRRKALRQCAGLASDRSQVQFDKSDTVGGMLWLARAVDSAPDDGHPLTDYVRTNLAAWAGRLNHVVETREYTRGDDDGYPRVVDPETGKRLHVAGYKRGYSPDRKTAVTYTQAGAAFVFQLRDVATGKPIGPPLPHEATHPAPKGDKPGQSPSPRAYFTHDGKVIVTFWTDHKEVWSDVRFWNASTGKPIGEPVRQTHPKYDVELSPDGQTIYIECRPPSKPGWELWLWEAATGRLRHGPLGGNAETEWLRFGPNDINVTEWGAFSPDSKLVASNDSGNHEIRFYDVATGKVVGTVAEGDPAASVVWSPDGKTFLTHNGRNGEALWNAVTFARISPLIPPIEMANLSRFTPDGKGVVALTREGRIVLWDASSGAVRTTARVLENLTPPLFGWVDSTTPGRLIAHGNRLPQSPDGWFQIWEYTGLGTDNLKLWSIVPPQFTSFHVQVSDGLLLGLPDSGSITYAPRPQNPVAQIKTADDPHWYWTNFAPGAQSYVAIKGVRDKNGKWTTTGQELCDTATGTMRYRHVTSGEGCVYSPDGSKVLLGSGGKNARVVEAATGRPVGPEGVTDFGQEPRTVTNPVKFSPDGAVLLVSALSSDGRGDEIVVATATGRLLARVAFPSLPTYMFTPDGRRFVTFRKVEGKEEVQLWRVPAEPLAAGGTGDGLRVGQPFHTEKCQITFGPDGKRFLLSDEVSTPGGTARRRLRLCDTDTGTALSPPREYADEKATGSSDRLLCVSPDLRTVVTATNDTAQIRDLVTRQPAGEPLEHGGPVHLAAFSPDGGAVVTVSRGSKKDSLSEIRWWNAPTGSSRGKARQHETKRCLPDLLHVLEPGERDRRLDIDSITFSPDGKVMLAAGYLACTLWAVATTEPIGKPLPGGEGDFTPDGKTVVTWNRFENGRAVHLYESATGRPIGPAPFAEDVRVEQIARGRLLTENRAFQIQLWDLPAPVRGDAERITLWVQVITGAELNADGDVHWLSPREWDRRRQRLQELGGPPVPPARGEWPVMGKPARP